MMDTTPKYIKMCEKAKKDIRKPPEMWDWYWDKEQKQIEVITALNEEHPMGNTWHKDEIPLYRQDQLQAMADYNLSVIDALQMLIAHFYSFTDAVLFASDNWQKHQKYLKQFNSMEQLWLAYIMHEKYGKVWDDEKEEWNCPTNAHTFKQEKGDLNSGES